MKYEPYIIDVHNEWHTPDSCPDMPVEATTPSELFRKLLDWAGAKNVMPKAIEVSRDDQ